MSFDSNEYLKEMQKLRNESNDTNKVLISNDAKTESPPQGYQNEEIVGKIKKYVLNMECDCGYEGPDSDRSYMAEMCHRCDLLYVIQAYEQIDLAQSSLRTEPLSEDKRKDLTIRVWSSTEIQYGGKGLRGMHFVTIKDFEKRISDLEDQLSVSEGIRETLEKNQDYTEDQLKRSEAQVAKYREALEKILIDLNEMAGLNQ